MVDHFGRLQCCVANECELARLKGKAVEEEFMNNGEKAENENCTFMH